MFYKKKGIDSVSQVTFSFVSGYHAMFVYIIRIFKIISTYTCDKEKTIHR